MTTFNATKTIAANTESGTKRVWSDAYYAALAERNLLSLLCRYRNVKGYEGPAYEPMFTYDDIDPYSHKGNKIVMADNAGEILQRLANTTDEFCAILEGWRLYKADLARMALAELQEAYAKL